jgi:transmembrane sensor
MEINESEVRAILTRYINGTATPRDTEILEKFFEESKQDVLREKINPAEYRFLESRLKAKIDSRIFPGRNYQSWMWKVAAAISLIAVIAYAFLQGSHKEGPVDKHIAILEKRTTSGQRITVRLSDGSTVKLNSNTRLAFPERFNNGTREVTIEGEGFFNVAHDPSVPFIVHTSNSSTRVLGTTFNVRAKNSGSTEVTLVTGKVDVSATHASDGRQLRPNQQAIIVPGGNRIDTASVDVRKFIDWKDNILSFDHTPLTEVIARLEEWYGVDIELKSKAIEGCSVTARYDSESLENVLKSLQFMLKGSYTIKGRKATLTGKGCVDL